MSTKKIVIAGGAVVVIAGILFWYFRHKKHQALSVGTAPAGNTIGAPNPAVSPPSGQGSTSGITSTSAPDTGDPVRNALLTRYSTMPKEVAVINNADGETLRLWSLIVSIWNTAGQNPYAFDIYGKPTTDYTNTIGKWWELFSQRNGF